MASRAVVSLHGLTGEGSISNLTYLWADGLRASGPCWFLAGGLFSFFATWSSPERRWRGEEEPAACFMKASKEQSVRKTEVAVLYKVIPEASSNHLCLFYWLEASLRSCPNTRGAGQEDTNSRERKSPRTILEPAHMAFLFLCKKDTVVESGEPWAFGLQCWVWTSGFATCHVNVDEATSPP